jgi:hypothetical protein
MGFGTKFAMQTILIWTAELEVANDPEIDDWTWAKIALSDALSSVETLGNTGVVQPPALEKLTRSITELFQMFTSNKHESVSIRELLRKVRPNFTFPN